MWALRNETAVSLIHPSDMDAWAAQEVVRGALGADASRHLLWAVVDGLIFIVSGALAIVPGPNLIAYYFAFRAVGHLLSYRGARQGLDRVTWQPQASDALAELRAGRRDGADGAPAGPRRHRGATQSAQSGAVFRTNHAEERVIYSRAP